jgi:alginate O-acetyltransferase complex protein AlgI
MVFSSILFLFVFLPAFLLAYYLTPNRYRNVTAALASMLFYAWGAPNFLFVLLGCAVIDFNLGRLVHRERAARRRKLWLGLSLAINLGLLAFFKYANFGVDQLNAVLGALGLSQVAWARVALPIGISFFTFHKISYIVDVYRGATAPAERFSAYLLYLLFFPQLIAGPIIRYHDVAAQLECRSHTAGRFLSGVCRFCVGLGKKVLIANSLAEVADFAFGTRLGALAPAHAWIGITAYTFQLYFDFSGYSDMAIGLGRMAGIEFLENFNKPYLAGSFTEFWRRWHISLSNFMREYLYIPLGGNRTSPGRAYLNLWIVFLLSGFWHGAAWPFIIWGAYHGLFLTLDKMFWLRAADRLPRWVAIPPTFLLVMIGWVFFRSPDLVQAQAYLLRMFGATQAWLPSPTWANVISHRAAFVLILAAALCFAPAIPAVGRLMARLETREKAGLSAAGYALALALLVLSACALAGASFNPFIYFRF